MDGIGKNFYYVSIIISLAVLLAFAIFVKNAEGIFYNYYMQQFNDYGSVFKKTIEISEEYTRMYDQIIANELYYKLSAINLDLQDVPLEYISDEMLKDIKEKYNLFGTAIFSQDTEGVFIYNSSIRGEIDEKTKDWGYWNEAFEGLFKEEHNYKDYWIGPRSKSHYEPGFFHYAYYYNKKQGYIINATIKEDDARSDNVHNMLKEFFEHLQEEISYIEAISFIDLKAWQKAYHNNFKNPEAPAFLYGNLDKDILIQSGLTPETLCSIDGNKSFSFEYEGDEKSLFMTAAVQEDNKYLITILLNDREAKIFIGKTFTRFIIFLIFTLVTILGGVFYIIKRYKNILTFQAERNKEIERFTKNLAMLPESVYMCKEEDGQLLLTYNYGKSINKEQEISLKSSYHPLSAFYSQEYVARFREKINDTFKGESRRFEIAYEDEHYEHFVSPVFNEKGLVEEIIGISTNISDRRIQEEKSKYMATHDFLTNLINRRAFEDEVKRQISEAPEGDYALMVMDLDDFKNVNDSHGHIAGDLVLRQVANRIGDTMKKLSSGGLAARMGGDEFAVFTTYKDISEIINIAEAIIEAGSQSYAIQGKTLNLGISIGIAIYNEDAIAYQELVHCADMAMYNAKQTKGTSYVFY